MTKTTVRHSSGHYALGRTPEEYQRLRAQARVWEEPTLRALDRLELRPGARCLDAGCGPGETMRLLAEAVGPTGEVIGLDIDGELGQLAVADLHRSGHRQCSFTAHDVAADRPIPHARFDVVYARLLIFHLPQRVAALRRLWDAVAPGGHLLVQDYDLRTIAALPPLDSVDEANRVYTATFGALGADIHAGSRMADLFARAGIGTPDGTEVAGRIEPLDTGRFILEHTLRSLVPAAVAHGVTTPEQADAALAALAADAAAFPERPLLWPLMIATWKRKNPS
jgi:SAM-dependent methyltransferase